MKYIKGTFLHSFAFVFLFLFFFFILAFAEKASEEPISNPRHLNIAYSAETFSGVDINDARIALEAWGKHLTKKLRRPYKTKALVFEDLSSMVKSMKSGEVDMAVLLSLDYFKVKNDLPIVPSLIGVTGENITDEYIILVRKNSGIKKLSQLKGKKLNIKVGGRGQIALLWLDTLLLKKGLPECKNLFKSIKKANKASQVLLPVFFGQADVCIVTKRSFDTMVELNPQLGKEIVILATSPDLLFSVTCFSKDYNKEWEEEIIESSLKLHEEVEGRQILTFFHQTEIIPFKFSYLEGVKLLRKEHNELKGKK